MYKEFGAKLSNIFVSLIQRVSKQNIQCSKLSQMKQYPVNTVFIRIDAEMQTFCIPPPRGTEPSTYKASTPPLN